MAHFAKIENNIVTQVIVAEQEFIDTLEGEWVQTSYNTRGGVHYQPDSYTPSSDQSKALRKNYAAIGYVYDKERDAFYEPKVFDSFTLDEETCTWKAPTPYPKDGKMYEWNEENQQWDLLTA
tara:strand:- start:113 stop:478 length:366 start_codon:yes stop_codon:yes gene_type:complete